MQLALVTGGADGLGLEFCRLLLASNKYNVCFGDINEEKGKETLKSLGSEFGVDRVQFLRFDVSSDADWSTAWEEAERRFNMSIYLLVNNAGIGSNAGWRKNVDVMLVGHMKGAFLALEKMSLSKGGKGGRILNVASVAGLLTGNMDFVGYTVAKWGSVAFTLSFANADNELFEKEGVKAMAICPWMARTNILKGFEHDIERTYQSVARVLTVEEVGQAFLKILELDENGHMYAVMPNSPLLDIPNLNQTYFLFSYVVGRFLAKPLFGMDVMNVRQVTLILMGLVFALLFLFFFGTKLIF